MANTNNNTAFKHLVPIGPGFWNIRGSFKIFKGLIDIGKVCKNNDDFIHQSFIAEFMKRTNSRTGTHMSIIQLSSGKFVVVDTIPLTDETKAEIDQLTENGTQIEAVLATHPFHTLAFPTFHAAYPNAAYYGCPRHLRKQPELGWVGNLNDCSTRNKWSPEIEMRIPEGSEFVAPEPETHNHFSCVFVFHPASRTIHVDDTIMIGSNPGILLKLAGYKHGTMSFHPSIKNVGLFPTAEAPYQFRDWLKDVIQSWDFDNICAAHMGNKVGGAKTQLTETLDKAEPLFKKISDRNKSKKPATVDPNEPQLTVTGNECG